MDSTVTTNNGPKQTSLNKSRSNNNFSHAAVHKSDVGDFQEGYFVMTDMPPLPNQRPNKTHKTPERNQRRKQHPQTTKDIEQLVRESEMHVSDRRLPTSPTRSPPRNNNHNRRTYSPPQQAHQTMYDQSMSPHKPRKAQYHEKHARSDNFSLDNLSGSPPKDKVPSPPSTSRWAGPAFSNAPPPSSLPMPEFPPFQPSPTMSPLSSSPPQYSGPATAFAPMIYPEPQLYIQPHPYAPVAYPAAYSVHLSYADVPSYEPQNLVQLSTDLRRMLNISHPIPA